MLGNDADRFMKTPMPTSVTTQARSASAAEMPAPRPTSRVSHAGFLPGLGNQDMLPGMGAGDGFMPGFGSYVDAPGYSGTAGLLDGNMMWVVIGGAALAGYFLFFRK